MKYVVDIVKITVLIKCTRITTRWRPKEPVYLIWVLISIQVWLYSPCLTTVDMFHDSQEPAILQVFCGLQYVSLIGSQQIWSPFCLSHSQIPERGMKKMVHQTYSPWFNLLHERTVSSDNVIWQLIKNCSFSTNWARWQWSFLKNLGGDWNAPFQETGREWSFLRNRVEWLLLNETGCEWSFLRKLGRIVASQETGQEWSFLRNWARIIFLRKLSETVRLPTRPNCDHRLVNSLSK